MPLIVRGPGVAMNVETDALALNIDLVCMCMCGDGGRVGERGGVGVCCMC